jgi:hypothetical protein
MAQGKKTGGRKKGVPNKLTSVGRQAFMATFGKLEGDLEKWIRETAEGFEAVHFLSDGRAIPYLEKNPGKAADLLIRMAEYHFPKLGRTEVTGKDGGPVVLDFGVDLSAATK